MNRTRSLALCAMLFACGGSGNVDIDAGNDASTGNDSGGTDAVADSGGGDGGACPMNMPMGSSCDPGFCYCPGNMPECYSTATAVTCCGGTVQCASDGGGSPDAAGCTFKHPLVDGSARFCEPGNCYCKWSTTGESCYPVGTVATCCAADSFTCY